MKFFFVSKINQNLLNFLSYLFSCVVCPAVFRTLKSVELSINFKRTPQLPRGRRFISNSIFTCKFCVHLFLIIRMKTLSIEIVLKE